MRASFNCRLTGFAGRFARDERGAVSVEAVLWIPFFFVLLMLITDASLAFFSKAQAFRVIEAGNRAFSIKNLTSTAATELWIENEFKPLSRNVNAITTVDKARGIVFTTLEYPARDVSLFGSLNVLKGWKITVRSQQYVEWKMS